jgi:hypothetical protein
MKRTQRFTGAAVVLAAALLSGACLNLLEGPVEPRQEGVTVTFTIDGEGEMARAVLPRMTQFVRMELTIQAQEGGETLPPVDISGGSASVTLGGGSWDITANAYTSQEAQAPAAAARNTVTNTGGVISGKTSFALEPTGTGPGTLLYRVSLPQEGISFTPEGSGIQLEQQGEVKEARTISGSVGSASLSLAPGIYAAHITLASSGGKTAAYRQAVSILSGLTTEIAFAPAAGDFLDPTARALLTGQVMFKTTPDNSSQTVLGSGGGGDVSRTQAIKAPRGNATVYFSVQKTAAQTLTLSGPGAARAGKPTETTDGAAPSNTLTVFAVDTADIAETGGTIDFVITAGETGKTPIDTAVTLTIPWVTSLSAYLISITGTGTPPLTYQLGDEFRYDYLSVTSTNSDGSTTGPDTLYDVEGFDTTSPGTKTIKVASKNGVYAKFLHNNAETVEIKVIERINSRLVFDYGRRVSAADTPPAGYATPLGRSLVLAPVKWGIPDDAVYTWTVSGGSHSSASSVTEYFTFNPTAQGEYTVTVSTTVNGQPLSASTKVVCCPSEGTYQNTAAANAAGIEWAPGQFANNSSWSSYSLGGFGGRKTGVFNTSLQNNPGADLLITGNAFGTWHEPGIVWVAQDVNGNGLMDDAWYELQGQGVELMRRYAVTYYNDGSWQNNLGEVGNIPAAWYPKNAASPMTLTGTRIVSDVLASTGYVDTFTTRFDIGDAVQADGSPVSLAYIDFVMVQTGEHLYVDLFLEKSTEVMGIFTLYDYSRRVTGISNGNGGYAYTFINNSGYDLTVYAAVFNGPFSEHSLNIGASQTLTLDEATAYFDYAGGNVNFIIQGNTVTFSTASGG